LTINGKKRSRLSKQAEEALTIPHHQDGFSEENASPQLPATSAVRRVATQERAKQTVDKILQATSELLVEVGYHGVNTNAVARRAGLTPPAVYYFFPNKFALYEALAELLQSQIDVRLSQAVAGNAHLLSLGPTESLAIIDILIDEMAGFWRENPVLAIVWSGEWPSRGSQPPDVVFTDRNVAVLATLIPSLAHLGPDLEKKVFRCAVHLTQGLVEPASKSYLIGDAATGDFMINTAKQIVRGFIAQYLQR
jgi:AcrR family transcriptional regulator